MTHVRLIVLSLMLGACRQQVNWSPDLPWAVPVTVEWKAIDHAFDSSLSNALAAWDFAAGCPVAVRAHDAATANVSIQGYDGTACGRDQILPLDANAGTTRCDAEHAEVRLKVASDIREVFVVAEHELGHVLGLLHDDSALMRTSPDLEAEVMPLPSDADGAAVGKRYCHKASR